MSDTPYSATTFQATHNSYSGPFGDFDRGSIPEQLDRGIRFIEYDINWVNYDKVGDYQLGHEKPGLEVHHGGGNPSELTLTAWLELIATWSDANPDHVPITLGLDLKNNLAKLESVPEGNLAALNLHVQNALGDKLFTPSDLVNDEWPTVNEMRGRILVVMSGDTKSRTAYLKDHGVEPTLDMNSHGHIVEVHKSQLNFGLWYWTGQLQDDHRVVWHGHGQFNKGQLPTIAVNDDGWVLAVHQGHRRQTLYYNVGRLYPDGRLEMGDDFKLHGGTNPSVRFLDRAGLQLSLVYRSGNETYESIGTFNPSVPTVAWQPPQRTDKPLHEIASAEAGGRSVAVESDNTLLRYKTNESSGLVGYHRSLFVEYQRGNDDELADTWFYACSKKYLAWGQQKCAAGKLVRIWGFGREHAVLPKVSFAATDTPYEDWYQQYCKSTGTV